jgi:hypothetical protein
VQQYQRAAHRAQPQKQRHKQQSWMLEICEQLNNGLVLMLSSSLQLLYFGHSVHQSLTPSGKCTPHVLVARFSRVPRANAC